MSDTGDSSSRLRAEYTIGEDRVRMVARQLSEPRTANWIASEADYSHGSTSRILARLVDDGVLVRDADGTHTTYYPDYRHQVLQEAMRLRDSVESVEALTERLTKMKTQIREWQTEYDDGVRTLLKQLGTDEASVDEADGVAYLRSHTDDLDLAGELERWRAELVQHGVERLTDDSTDPNN